MKSHKVPQWFKKVTNFEYAYDSAMHTETENCVLDN